MQQYRPLPHPQSIQRNVRHVFPQIPGLDVVRVIGHGGHATVYLARQIDHDRQVAVKVLDAALDDTARRRFDRERSTLGRVSTHPGVVGLFDSGITADGRAYLVLEWAPGGSLEDHLADVSTMTIDDVTELGICLAGALEQAHRSGVMHRDIKPGNVVRSEFGDWLLTDFSVAAFTDPAIATDAVQVSLAHCPPEAFDRREPSAAADVYSLASVLRTALTGEEPNAPRAGETVATTIARISSCAVEPISSDVAGDDMAELIDSATDLDPARRPATMRELANRLGDVRTTSGLAPVTFRVGSDVTMPANGDGPSVSRPNAQQNPRHDRQPLTNARVIQPTTGRVRRLMGAVALLAGVVLGGLGATTSLQSDGIVASVAAASIEVVEPAVLVAETPIAPETPTGLDADAPDAETVDDDTNNDGDNNNDGGGDGNNGGDRGGRGPDGGDPGGGGPDGGRGGNRGGGQ